MDRLTSESSNSDKVSLLTIPLSDLDSSKSSETLLLQLPPKWTVSDLKNAHFCGSSDDNNNKNAAIVTNKKSFALYHVETSNTLILVPPASSSDDTDKQQEGNSSNKRSKVTEAGKKLTTVPARLLKMGGSGASFLELRETKLRRTDLMQALQTTGSCVLDPYNTTTTTTSVVTGRTVADLAATLQSSKYQVEQGLEQILQAYALPGTEPRQYVWLFEEAVQECNHAIVATLAEVDEYQDYAGSGIPLDDENFCQQVLERMSDEEKFDGAASVIRHCLWHLRDNTSTKRSSSTTSKLLRLDVSKVAACVARRLFQKQSAPWDEDTLFSVWQSELPGVGKHYQVKREMLAGLAVLVSNDDDDDNADDDETRPDQPRRLWKYLPADNMPSSDPTACFKELFAAKERWRIQELEPYLERLTDATSTSQADLLLRFTKLVEEDRDGITVKLYLKK